MFNFWGRKPNTGILGMFPYHVDVHSHVLPGIDDGARDVKTSIEIIRKMKQMGLQKIIATSHVTSESFPNNRETISSAWNILMEELKKEDIQMDVNYSAEYRLDELFDETYRNNQLIPFPQDYLLIENSFIQPYFHLDDLLFDLQTSRLTPIMAHIERYSYYYSEKKKVLAYKEQGCQFQVNLLSFSGYYGKLTKDFAMWLLNEQLIDFLGTDAHSVRHLDLLEQFLNSKAYDKIYPLILKNKIKNDTLL